MYGIQFIMNHQIFRRNTPLICGIVVHNKCNLKCRHCRISDRGRKEMTFEEIVSAMNSFYEEGGRTLYLEGGEPFLWRDRRYHLEDIVTCSHQIGFLSTIIYTNGTLPITTSAETVFISIDGLQKTHDFLRGESFNRIMNNIHNSSHSSLYVNYTINNYNKDEIQEFCEFINGIDQLKGIFFYFHTAYYGHDDLYVNPVERKEILYKLLDYTRKYKILNSRAGIKSALRNDWNRPLDICHIYEKGKIYKCCRYPGDLNLCQNCGYLSYAEIDQTLKLKPSAILNALKYF